MDGHLITSTYYQLLIMLLWIWVYKYLFEPLLSILLGIYLKVESCGRFNLLRNRHTVFHSCCTIYILTNSAQGIQYLQILTNTCYFLVFLVVAVLMGDISVWLWFALVMWSIFLYACLVFVCLLWRNIYSSPVFIFNWAIWAGWRGVIKVNLTLLWQHRNLAFSTIILPYFIS